MGRINDAERTRAKAEKEQWHRDHPQEAERNEERYRTAEERWAAMRRATDVDRLEEVTARFDEFDAAHFATGFWLHVSPVTAGDDILFVYVGATRPSPMPERTSLPFEHAGRTLSLRPGEGRATLGKRLRAAGIDLLTCTPQVAIAVGPIGPINAKIEAVETALAGHLCSRGYQVINEECPPHPFDRGLFGRVCDLIDGAFLARRIDHDVDGS